MLVNTAGLKTVLNAIKEYVQKQISSLYQSFKSLIKQPDWNQNDKSAQDYIKKPNALEGIEIYHDYGL